MEPLNFKNTAAQGDVYVQKIESLPDDLIKVEPENGQHVVAHSETGHNHVLPADDVDLFRAANDPLSLWVVAKTDTVLKHLRSFDTHAPIRIAKGIYRFINQREHTPEGWRRAID